MKNCRNCKYAKWQTDARGRRRFGYWAECTYKVVAVIPASLSLVKPKLNTIRAVADDRNIEVDCDAWEKLHKVQQ